MLLTAAHVLRWCLVKVRHSSKILQLYLLLHTTVRFSLLSSQSVTYTEGGCARRVSSSQSVSPVEDFERDSAERNTTFIAHTSPVHQDPLENWRDGTASALGHVPELGRTPE